MEKIKEGTMWLNHEKDCPIFMLMEEKGKSRDGHIHDLIGFRCPGCKLKLWVYVKEVWELIKEYPPDITREYLIRSCINI